MKTTWWIIAGIVVIVLVGVYAYTQLSPVSTPSTQVQTIATTSANTNHTPPVTPSTTPPGNIKPPVPEAQNTGTLSGTVILSPTCPVETNPPSPNCAPKPYVTQVTISRSGTTIMQVTTAQTRSDGSFEINLAPGSYVVSATGGGVYPRCSSVNTEVTENSKTNIVISCDTGIR